ncbi:hypothetical protein R3P38DRAFT_1707026 [Favolaschia claudopus]|uniref:Uncharacterized protein n=1 Tax=Favolaschia claudopus TaxID=2862362 RepID=A0AAW0AAV4_9AGAR
MIPTLPSMQTNRERRQWTAQEDELLRMAVSREEPGNPAPSKWHAIAQHVPNRTNKDCRKRWYAKMSSDVVKGGWAPDEDQRLLAAIDNCGTRWSLVASMVQTRNSDQCAKRWCDTLNPAIDRTAWTAEADDLLIRAVNDHGKVWTKIVQMYFPGRTGLAAKNRYNSITRAEDSSRGSSRRRHSPDSSPSPPFDLDEPEPYYSHRISTSYKRQSMSHPGRISGYPSSGTRGRPQSGGCSMSGFEIAPTGPSSSAYPYYPSPSQYPAQLPCLQPETNNNSSLYPDYSLLTQTSYPEMQYPDVSFDSTYPTSTYHSSASSNAIPWNSF